MGTITITKAIYKLILISLFVFLISLVCKNTYAATTGTLLPAGDGNYKQWTPSTGSTHYTLVDEASCNGNTDYVSTTTVNNRDSYTFNLSSVPNNSTITQISITPCVSKNSSGGSNSSFKVFYRLNGVNSADSAIYSLSGTTPADQIASNFTLSQTKIGTTTLEIGGVLTGGTKGARLSRIAAVITYTVPVPSAPSSLTVTPDSSTTAILTWTDNSTNENGFKIERSLDGSTGWSQVGSVSANIVTFTDTNLTAQQPYYYRVYGFNGGGNSGYSNVYGINTAIPNNPSHVTLTATMCGGGDVSMLLEWQDNAFNETGFDIEYSNDGLTYNPLTSVGTDVKSYLFTGSACNYRVRATNLSGNSDWAYLEVIK